MNYQELIQNEYDALCKTIHQSGYFSHAPLGDIIIQNRREIIDFIEFIANRCKKQSLFQFIEIGSRLGGTFALIGKCLAKICPKVIGLSIDLPNQPHENTRKKSLINALEAMQLNFEYKVILDDSHKPETLQSTKEFLYGPVDLVFIDGDHSEEGSYQDFVDYSKLLRPGGVIAYHDIVEPKHWPWVQVHKTWARIKKEHSKSPIKEWKYQNDGYGIGAIIL